MRSNRPFTFIILLCLSSLCISCSGSEINNNDSKETQINPPSDVSTISEDSFESKLFEYWDTVLIDKKVHEEFKPDYASFKKGNWVYSYPYTIEGSKLNEFKKSKAQIVVFDKSDSLSFIIFLNNIKDYIHLEAININDIQLSSESLERLFVGLSDKQYFKKLIFKNCGLKTLPASIGLLKNLETLDLSFNHIISLPKEIGYLKNLKYFRIYNNRLFRHLPDEIGNCKNLEYLDFAGTKLGEIPATIGNCTNLIKLVGNACKIERIPNEIGKCKNLQSMNLAANLIKDIPQSIGNLKELKRLSFGYNKINNLPGSFANLKNLWFCGLGHNNFSTFPEPVLGLAKVQNLWLHENSFSSVPSGIENLEKLTHFLVDESEIDKLDIEYLKESRPDIRIIDED